jgi:hypothetical protein
MTSSVDVHSHTSFITKLDHDGARCCAHLFYDKLLKIVEIWEAMEHRKLSLY